MKKYIIFIFWVCSQSLIAQATHIIEKGDTPYNISRTYGITLDTFYQLNPQLKNTDAKLNIGDSVVVNKSQTTKKEKTEIASSGDNFILLQPKQTIFGICKFYKISEEELRKLNPNLDENMKIGNKVFLPAGKVKKFGVQHPPTESTNPEISHKEKFAENLKEDAPEPSTDTYTVQAKDSIYGIGKKFNLTQKQLNQLNPNLADNGLKVGDVLIINPKIKTTVGVTKTEEKIVEPIRKTSKQNTKPPQETETYTVVDGDTVYHIVNKFGISYASLLELNPELSSGLKAGMQLKLNKDKGFAKRDGETLNVAVILPFGYTSNETKYRNISLDFLTGAKLALQRQAKEGMKINVNIIDEGDEASFKNNLHKIDKDNTDLIIGPFFKSSVLDLVGYLDKKNTPILVPFANSEDLLGYPNLLLAETSDKLYADRIAVEIAKIYKAEEIVLLGDKDEQNSANLKVDLESSLDKPNIKIINKAEEIIEEENMMTGQKVPMILVLTTKNNDIGNDFTNKVLEIAKNTSGTKAFSMFYQPSFEKKQNELSSASLVYFMDRKINKAGTFETEVLSDYKQKYCKTPPKYAIIGFDIVNDILSRESNNGELHKQLGKVQRQLATKFEYVKLKNQKAYTNVGYRVVRLMP